MASPGMRRPLKHPGLLGGSGLLLDRALSTGKVACEGSQAVALGTARPQFEFLQWPCGQQVEEGSAEGLTRSSPLFLWRPQCVAKGPKLAGPAAWLC